MHATAEDFAAACLSKTRIDSDDIIQLISLLPSEVPARLNPDTTTDCSFSFTVGAYVQGPMLGLRRTCHEFPNVCKMLTAYARGWGHDLSFTSLSLMAQVLTPLHADRNNAKGFPNFLIGVSTFSDGHLWLESPTGAHAGPLPHAHLRGHLLPVSNTCVTFDAQLRHATMPWTGYRLVLAGFVIRDFAALSEADHSALVSLGFSPPDLATGDVIQHGALLPIPRPMFRAPSTPVVFELFSGSSRVTACLRKLGLAAHGVDHKHVDSAACTPLIADLTTQDGQDLAMFWLCNPLLSAVFAAPPCGTCSRARDIPVSNAAGEPLPAPVPLRSASFPDGLRTAHRSRPSAGSSR